MIKYIVENGIEADEECLLVIKNTYKNVIIDNVINKHLELTSNFNINLRNIDECINNIKNLPCSKNILYRSYKTKKTKI